MATMGRRLTGKGFTSAAYRKNTPSRTASHLIFTGMKKNRSTRCSGYSEAKEAYLDAKHSYRSTKSPESKREMNVSLHECMEKLREELREMKTNADTTEERENIRAMLHEIGNLA